MQIKNKNILSIFDNFESFSNIISEDLFNYFKSHFNNLKLLDILMMLPLKFELLSIEVLNLDQLINLKIAIKLKIISIKKNLKILTISTKNNKNEFINLIFFKIGRNFEEKLKINAEFVFFGKLEIYQDKLSIIHPSILQKYQHINQDIIVIHTIKLREKYEYILKNNLKIFPIYNENSQYNAKFHFLLKEIFSSNLIDFSFLEMHLLEYHNLITILKRIHFPKHLQDLTNQSQILSNLAFYEILSSYYAIHLARCEKLNYETKYTCNKDNLIKTNYLLENLPFELTNDQMEAYNFINKKLQSKQQMTILLQGDVGSGKTIVSFLAILNIIDSGFKGCILAPTGILAKQHYENFLSLSKKLNLNIVLLTGKNSKKEKDSIKTMLRLNNIDILIATHAALYIDVELKNFGLFVIDEQHNFGVLQRNKLIQKSENPHILMTTATPIPRTLLMSLYQDIESIAIKEKPKNRIKIKTKIILEDKINILIERIKNILNSNQKVYWVCPLIEDEGENAKNALKNVKNRAKILQEIILEAKIEILHGKLKQEEKDKIMANFKDGKLNLLVATTVIEVGIDVKDASVIVIENAERFGLAQLHQLRGRVGRGNVESFCVLIPSKNTSENGLERLRIIEENDDGFAIAELDLKNRGGGQLLGKEQSGRNLFKFVEFTLDKKSFNLVGNIKNNFENTQNKDFINFLIECFSQNNKIELIKS